MKLNRSQKKNCFRLEISGKIIYLDYADANLLAEWTINVTPNGYAKTTRSTNGKYIYSLLHVEVVKAMGIFNKEFVTDHINCNKLDNRRSNLQVIPQYENVRKTYYGRAEHVSFCQKSKRWKVQIKIKGHDRVSKSFQYKQDAIDFSDNIKTAMGYYDVKSSN